jgi:hypothetical protein
MPTPLTSKWPKPKSEDEWEEMVLDAMRLYWSDPNAQRNGRRGQRQNGVDIFGCLDFHPVAAQAKNMDRVSEAEVLFEVNKAEKFTPVLTQYHFAIAGPRDEGLQNLIAMRSLDRVNHGLFPIYLHYFDDVCGQLSSRPVLIQKYWGAFLALSSLLDALPDTLSGPVLNPETAFERVRLLPQLRQLADLIEARSAGNANLSVRFEDTPRLDAPRGSPDRWWTIAIGENQQHRQITFCRVAVDVDSGSLSFFSVLENRWLSRSEWLQTGLWFN